MTERLVIQRTPFCWRFISRARLAAPGPGINLTPVGTAILEQVAAIDGAEVGITHVLHHRIDVDLVHADLWSWSEVEPQVIAAFARVLGCDVEVIREDAGPQARTEATT